MAETKGEVFSQAEEKMKKAVSVNLEDLSTIRSGRASGPTTPAGTHCLPGTCRRVPRRCLPEPVEVPVQLSVDGGPWVAPARRCLAAGLRLLRPRRQLLPLAWKGHALPLGASLRIERMTPTNAPAP